MGNLYSLEAVVRGSETQLQVGEHFEKDNFAGKGLMSSQLCHYVWKGYDMKNKLNCNYEVRHQI